jgi:hypothetical protein
MAIIQLSGLVSDIRGSIGGNTYQRSAGGMVVRSKPKPVGRGTNSQFNQRNIISQLNFLWNSLTDTQRSQWSSFAQYTNGVNRTNNQRTTGNNGKTQFFAVNSWLLLYGYTFISVPTFAPPLNVLPPYIDAQGKSDNLGRIVGNLDVATQFLVVQVSLPQSFTTVTANTGFRTMVFTSVDGSVQDWTVAYLNQFGLSLEYGRKYWVSTRVVDYVNGNISAEAKALILYEASSGGGIGSMVVGSTFIVS